MWFRVPLSSRKTLFALLLGAGLLVFLSRQGQAQGTGSAWSPPELLFDTPSGETTNELWLLRDQADVLYVWWPVFSADEQAAEANAPRRVFHTQWVDGQWQKPVDILLAPDADHLTTVVIDATGILHAFSATNCVSYVRANHNQAMDPRGWGRRRCLDDTGNTTPMTAQGPDGTIYVVYAAPGTQALRLAVSRDRGVTWSFLPVADTNIGFFDRPTLAADKLGRLHLVWSPASPPEGYPLLGVLYTRSDDGGQTWTKPVQLGQEKEGQAAIAVHGDEVHVLWNGDAAKRGRYYRLSRDAGESWGPVKTLSPPASEGGYGGLQRPPAIIVDNAGNVHALLHEQESLYYVTRNESGWTAKELLYVPEDFQAVEIFTVRLAITGGNQLHAVYTLASGETFHKRIYHQTRPISARIEMPTPWPIVTIFPSPTATTASRMPTPTSPSKVEKPSSDTFDQSPVNGPALPIVVGSLGALTLIGGIGLSRALWLRRQ